MTVQALFPSRLGSSFALLDPQLQWVHGGESRDLSGTVTVERGNSLMAKVLGALTSLPPALGNAPILVRIEVAGDKERWIRTYAGGHRMTSTLYKDGGALVEQIGPVALAFRIVERDAGMDWQLQKIWMLGIPLPVSWFRISARVDMQQGRYRFLIDSSLSGIGRIVRYEGLLDVGRFVSVELRGLDQAHDGGGTPTSANRSGEEPVRSSQSERPPRTNQRA